MKRTHPACNDQGRESKLDGVASLSRSTRRSTFARITTKPRCLVAFSAFIVLVEVAFIMRMITRLNSGFDHCLLDCEKKTSPRTTSKKVPPHPLLVPPYDQKENSTERTRRQSNSRHPGKDSSSVKVWAYNSWSSDMYLCGQSIVPNRTTQVVGGEACQETPGVFLEEPTMRNVPSEVIEVRALRRRVDRFMTLNCTVPCRFADIGGGLFELTVKGTNWKIKHTLESPAHYQFAEVRDDDWKNDTYYSTTSFKSEIPLPYFWLDMDIKTPPVEYEKVIKGASFIAGNCHTTRNHRTAIVEELMQIIRVDSLGNCIHNAEPPDGVDRRNKDAMQKPYLFHLAFENSNVLDHVTEKVWGTLRSGTLPVYMGAPNIKELVPENSIISWHDFDSTRELGEYLKVVAANRSLYESYHTWRLEPTLPERFLNKYNFTYTHAACRTCKWAYAKQRGLGWDHKQQDLRPLYKSRRLCVDSANFIIEPFRETLPTMAKKQSLASDSHCHEDRLPRVAMLGNLTRTVSYHDGVVDIVLKGTPSEPYRISTDMDTTAIRLRDNVYQMQDELSRITFAVDESLSVSPIEAGVLVFHHTHGKNGEKQRIRVISEDVDRFHSGASEAMSYFGNLMVSQFEKPLRFFKAGARRKKEA